MPTRRGASPTRPSSSSRAISSNACDGVDGVLLHLHGAMATESSDDGEGELLARLRKRLGPDIPIVAVLDLHATLTQLMADSANVR
jgi:microcystin degradation protein MlrC